MPVTVQPFSINICQEVLDDLRDRLRRTRWPGEVPGSGWNRGVDLDYMKELVEYWLDEYDWREQEARLNELPHFKADIDGLGVHFIHVKGKGPNPLPLFMMHGYPCSLRSAAERH
jgi:epoxide hydrolase